MCKLPVKTNYSFLEILYTIVEIAIWKSTIHWASGSYRS